MTLLIGNDRGTLTVTFTSLLLYTDIHLIFKYLTNLDNLNNGQTKCL